VLEDNDSASVPMDKLARVYRKMQTRIQELTAEYETQVESLKAQQDAVKQAMKDQMLALGIDSVKTAEGTVILSTKTRYSTNDWDEFKRFVVEHDALDLFEKRIAQTNMATFLKENPGLVPPGLNSNAEYAISVRKPSSR
jgi:hypothetical protein